MDIDDIIRIIQKRELPISINELAKICKQSIEILEAKLEEKVNDSTIGKHLAAVSSKETCIHVN